MRGSFAEPLAGCRVPYGRPACSTRAHSSGQLLSLVERSRNMSPDRDAIIIVMTSLIRAPGASDQAGVLGQFHPAVRTWFGRRFPHGPTEAQAGGWPSIAAGNHTLICAPTGSGKTL